MRTRDIITATLILGACLVAGDKLWTIALAAGMILAALALQGGRHETSDPDKEA